MTQMERRHTNQKIGKAVYNIAMQVAANAVCLFMVLDLERKYKKR